MYLTSMESSQGNLSLSCSNLVYSISIQGDSVKLGPKLDINIIKFPACKLLAQQYLNMLRVANFLYARPV